MGNSSLLKKRKEKVAAVNDNNFPNPMHHCYCNLSSWVEKYQEKGKGEGNLCRDAHHCDVSMKSCICGR
jgi:hypothetical protein